MISFLVNLKEAYCDLLVKFKSDLSKPFDEATAFLNDMEMQLNSICNGHNNSGFSLSHLLHK